jgi:hypothetical protein
VKLDILAPLRDNVSRGEKTRERITKARKYERREEKRKKLDWKT